MGADQLFGILRQIDARFDRALPPEIAAAYRERLGIDAPPSDDVEPGSSAFPVVGHIMSDTGEVVSTVIDRADHDHDGRLVDLNIAANVYCRTTTARRAWSITTGPPILLTVNGEGFSERFPAGSVMIFRRLRDAKAVLSGSIAAARSDDSPLSVRLVAFDADAPDTLIISPIAPRGVTSSVKIATRRAARLELLFVAAVV